MFSRTHTRTFATCGARTLLREASRATPLGGGLGYITHPHSISHGAQQQIITYRRFPWTTDSAMTFMCHNLSSKLGFTCM